MLVAAVVILAGVVVVASGRGGEMAASEPDYPPIDLGPVTSADVALLRPPSAAWGYNMRVTDQALEVIAKAVTERDVQIAALQQEVSDLRDQLGGSGRTATLDPPGGSPAEGTADGTAEGPAEGPAEGTADGTAEGPAAEPAEDQKPAEPQLPEPDWSSQAGDTEAAGPAVPITRPQPIYHAEGQGEGPRRGEADQPEAPPEASAPWGPAEPPGREPLWEPPHQPAAGWSADPADTSPDATAVDPGAGAPGDPGGEVSLPITPATGWRVQEQSVWDEASRQVDQEQTRAPGPGHSQAPAARRRDAHEFRWDDDPHQQVVWGAEHARAKAARVTEETLPNAEHRDEDRG